MLKSRTVICEFVYLEAISDESALVPVACFVLLKFRVSKRINGGHNDLHNGST